MSSYLQHRNHVADGADPWPGCQFCEQWIIQPAIREFRGDYPELDGCLFIDLDQLGA